MRSIFQPRKRAALDASAFKQTALFSLAFLFAAHAFCFFNLTYSSGSVMLNVSSGRSAQIAAGQYLLPIYWRIRGSISSPLFVGMLSMLYLTCANMLLVWLLHITKPLARLILCGATTVNAAVLSICAASMHTADATFLSMLIAVIACAVCLHIHVLPGALLLTGALALDPGSCAYFAALMLIAAINELLLGGQKKTFVRDILHLILAVGIGIAVYWLGYTLMARRSGLDMHSSLLLWGGNLLQAYTSPIRALLAPLTVYPMLNTLLRAVSALICLYVIIRFARTNGAASAAMLALGIFLLPLFAGFSFLSGQENIQITPAHCLIDILIILLLIRVFPSLMRVQRLACAAFCALFLGSIVFSNQVYLKKNLELESTLSVMTRVIARIEEMPGYMPGYTPIAIIGTPENSAISSQRKGFEHLSALDAASNNYAITSDTDMIWYTWEVLGYPLNFVSAYDLEQLKQNADVQAMPAFPQEGCCSYIGDTLVIHLS